jgi:2,4-dienoyl-CoA reductase-like NADH-dependent reductase (Old Yellow Enzyme family)
MSILFSSETLGNMDLKNRFVHSATYECMAGKTGEVTDGLVKRYRTLARGEIGLIIPGYLFVHPVGRAMKHQTGIHVDDMIPGLQRIVDAVHQGGSKIAFQLAHAGSQTSKSTIGQTALAPSRYARNPVTLKKPKEMSVDEIQEVIQAFVLAAGRAVEAGADAIQLHGAHGYLISEFLSPFYNRRQDDWGGSDERRFRFLKEIFLGIKSVLPSDISILVKLNTNDFTPRQGTTPELTQRYARWLDELGIDGVEVSCGTYHTFHTVRGEIPSKEIAAGLPKWMRPFARYTLKKQEPRCVFEEEYNLPAAKFIKPVLKRARLLLVGGVRRLSHMEEVVQEGFADLISLSRPLIREPLLIKHFKEEKKDKAACTSCNKCWAAVFNNLPVRCYHAGLPTP